MGWFNRKMNNENFNKDEEINEEETAEIPFRDKRRVSEDGERINVEINDGNESPPIEAEPAKSAEVVKLENALQEVMTRCEAAETKLVGVQQRFEEEKAKLERETAERRERMKKSLEQRAEQGRLNFLNTLLPVLDNLNLAISAAEQNNSFENLIGGVKGTARSFEQALINVGVETIDSEGQKFDPQLHEAVEMKEVDDESLDGIITHEFTEGYTFKGRLLRAARVQVGKAAQKQASAE
jgi:molecular chaperone GrpE